MRHNQNNGRRFRNRGNNNGQGNHGGGHNHNNHNNNNGGGRRVNPRIQTFDSNGPDVRIRGNAYQINEKYLALAKDASSAGDRVLAESYLQHAEHYQRLINEMTEEYNRYQSQFQQQPSATDDAMSASGAPDGLDGQDMPEAAVVSVSHPGAEQPSDEGLNDLDQSFLRGPRTVPVSQPAAAGEEGEASAQPVRQPRQRVQRQPRETEQV